MAEWPGCQLHSHNYRGAEQFRGQRVMVVGASFSGQCNGSAGLHVVMDVRFLTLPNCPAAGLGP